MSHPGTPDGPAAPPPQPPQPPKKSNTGKIVGFSCLGVVAAFIIIGIIAALAVGGSDEGTNNKADDKADSAPKDTPKGDDKAKSKEEEPASESPIKITATTTEFTPSVLHDGSDFTSVKVTVTNNSDQNVEVNPLSFAITDTNGTKHNADALGQDKNQIDTLTLGHGENVTGTVTAKGAFEPAKVAFEENLFGDPITADVK